MVPHSDPIRNFLQHGDFFDSDLKGRKSASLWTCIVWAIWKARNDRVFNEINPNSSKVAQEIKAKVWSWFVTKNV